MCRKASPFWFLILKIVLILKISYFPILCPVFQSAGSRSNLHWLWALLILIPVPALVYRGKFLTLFKLQIEVTWEVVVHENPPLSLAYKEVPPR